ncbi:MAG: S-methyl-5-thioribose-1-phosphate isomerase [Burkholderiales bacterium]|nr:S-methyl-5-thioribose-1-phosphate isomerase [Burkholderiales bacterium]
MKVDGRALRSIKIDKDLGKVWVLDQRLLPHKVEEIELKSLDEVIKAIKQMTVRGAPLIGVTAAAGLALACSSTTSAESIQIAADKLIASRPTAVNLYYAVDRALKTLLRTPQDERRQMAWAMANQILLEELDRSYKIGQSGVELIKSLYEKKQRPITVLTHCNAGWLATVDYGTATAPIYAAHEQGVPVQVLADETRPRLQGTLTAWELSEHGIPVKLVADNAGGFLMRQGKVDLVITGADRIASNGDTANKIGTYLKALAAFDNGVPFYIAAPKSTFDWSTENGNAIPIEERGADEVRLIKGLDKSGNLTEVLITDPEMEVVNPGFDITPGHLITGFITEYGIFKVSEFSNLKGLHE